MAFTFTPACCRLPTQASSGLGALSHAASRRRFSTRFAKMPMKRRADEPCRMVILVQGGDERAASVPVGSSATAVDERHRALRQEVAHHGMRLADQRRAVGGR